MITRCAQIKNGSVVNVILADPGFDPGDGSTLVASKTAQIGDLYDGHAFTTPAPVVVYQTQGLNFLQFMALFTPSEQAAIVGSANVQVKLFTLMAAGAPSIDLDNAQVIGGIGYLVSQGLVTNARAMVVLSGALPV